MEIDEIKEKTLVCIKKLEENEIEIIQNDINERTIAHKLAEYLQVEFNKYNVDIEYNRNLEIGEYEPKYALLVKKGFEEAYQETKSNDEDIVDFMEQVTTYPDIIIHKRGNNENNILIIEIKKNNNKTKWEIDKKKLEAFTREKNNEGYGYKLGMHLIVSINKPWTKPIYNWYQNGTIEKL